VSRGGLYAAVAAAGGTAVAGDAGPDRRVDGEEAKPGGRLRWGGAWFSRRGLTGNAAVDKQVVRLFRHFAGELLVSRLSLIDNQKELLRALVTLATEDKLQDDVLVEVPDDRYGRFVGVISTVEGPFRFNMNDFKALCETNPPLVVLDGDHYLITEAGYDAVRTGFVVSKEDSLSLQRQLANARESLRLIQEREAEYPLSTDIPLLLVKEKRHLLERITELEQRLAAQSAALEVQQERVLPATTGHVFISYAREDQTYARKLADALRARGFETWIDNRIETGDRWWQTIDKAIRASAAFVVVMTPDAEKSDWVEKEIMLALEEGKPIFPLLLSGKRFSILINKQFANVSGGQMPPASFYEQLAQVAPSKSKAEQQSHIRKLQGVPLPLFEDDFQHGLGAWTIRNGQSPQADKDGLLLKHFGDNDLSKMVVLKGYEFVDGVIECEVDLTLGAVFNVVFRANLVGSNPKRDGEFYLARFDTREDKLPKRKTRDGILFKPKGDRWDLCETGALDHSPPGTLMMRVEVSGSYITLYRGKQLIEQISNAKQPGNSIALLAEKQDVHVRMIRVIPG
jgi:hypothetical protein